MHGDAACIDRSYSGRGDDSHLFETVFPDVFQKGRLARAGLPVKKMGAPVWFTNSGGQLKDMVAGYRIAWGANAKWGA